METLRGMATMASNAGTEIPQVTAALADPEHETRLKEAETAARRVPEVAHHSRRRAGSRATMRRASARR